MKLKSAIPVVLILPIAFLGCRAKKMYVHTFGFSLYEEPHGKNIGGIAYGEQVQVFAERSENPDAYCKTGKWARIGYQNLEGWTCDRLSSQPPSAPRKIPAHLAINTTALTEEQAMVSLFGQYSEPERTSTWTADDAFKPEFLSQKEKTIWEEALAEQKAKGQHRVVVSRILMADVTQTSRVIFLLLNETDIGFASVFIAEFVQGTKAWELKTMQELNLAVDSPSQTTATTLPIGMRRMGYVVVTPHDYGVRGEMDAYVFARVGEAWRRVFQIFQYRAIKGNCFDLKEKNCVPSETYSSEFQCLPSNRNWCDLQVLVSKIGENAETILISQSLWKFDGEQYRREPPCNWPNLECDPVLPGGNEPSPLPSPHAPSLP